MEFRDSMAGLGAKSKNTSSPVKSTFCYIGLTLVQSVVVWEFVLPIQL